jgi:PAS domain S-box-containing protein
MRRRNGLIVILGIVAACIGISRLSAQQIVKVGMDENPPLISTREDGVVEGFFVDILEYIAKKESWRVEYHSFGWAECLDQLEEGNIDLVLDIAYSTERDLKFEFTTETVLPNWGILYGRKGNGVGSITDLDGIRIAVIEKDIYNEILHRLMKQFALKPIYIGTDSYPEVFRKVFEGEADVGLVSRYYGVQNESSFGLIATSLVFGPVELRFATTQDRNETLLRTLDYHLYSVKRDYSSVYHRGIAKWLEEAYIEVIPRWLSILLVAFGMATAVAILVIVILNAILRRRKTELIISERAYRNLVGDIDDVIYTTDAEGIVTYISPVVKQISGYSAEETIGKHFSDFIQPKDSMCSEDSCLQTEGNDAVREECRLITKERVERWVRITCRSLREKGAFVGKQGVITDITDQKRLLEQLQEAQRMEAIARLTAGIAHDFNNLLTIIQGYTELMTLQSLPPEISAPIEDIRTASARAASLTNQLLAFSRHQILEPQVINPNKLITDIKKLLLPIIGEDVRLDTILEPAVDLIKVDPVKFEQVIMNLVVNARDAMPNGGLLTISTSNIDLDSTCSESYVPITPGPYVQITISDTGEGMTTEVMKHIFEPFYTTKELGRGTGLGLSTVYGIVQQSGGYIWPYSELGVGSTFKVYLPRVSVGESLPIKHVKPPVVQSGTEIILLVEDDSLVRKFLAMAVSKYGYTVLEAASPAEALPLFEQNRERIDLVLTDVVMSGSSGAEMAQKIRETAPHTRIVYMSGYDDEVIVHHGIVDEGINFLSKPFTIDVLLSKLREVLNQDDNR